MEIVSLDGQLALKVSLQKPYIHIKRYEPYGEEVEKATIATITEDMYVDWEVSTYQGNIEEFLQSARDCCQYGIYAKEDIEKYQGLVRHQDYFGQVELNKTYYDSRIIDGMEGDSVSSELKFYDSNDSQIPQKNKKFLFWIEVHTSAASFPSLHICFHIDAVRLLGENIHFILDTKSKYVILEACRVFAVLRKNFIIDSKKQIQHIFKTCLDSFQIANAFGLILNECGIYEFMGQNDAYLICPKDMRDDEIIIKNFPADCRIFNQYELTFTHCVFKFSDKNKNYDLLIGYFEKPIKFDACIFKIDISAKAIFKEKISFKNSVFECPVYLDGIEFYGGVDFQSAVFKKGADFHGASFGIGIAADNQNTQSNNPEYSFFAATFESSVHFESAHFYHKAGFSNASFKKEAQFYNATFEQLALFPNATFGDYTSFGEAKFNDEASFSRAHFEGGAYFTSSSFKQNACFMAVTFHGNANFDHVKFQAGEGRESEGIADFSGAHFQKTAELNATFGHDANFRGAIFDDNAYFDGAVFQKRTNFNLCHFYQSTYFYGAIFQDISQYETLKDIPFYQTNFHSDVYLSSDIFDFDFKHLKTIIDQDKDNERSETKTNKLRQMFRGVKSSFIDIHNHLDAAHYHKMELYCKELELGYRRDDNVENSGIRDFVDRIHLMAYRLTSDHHTDLLLILNNVIILIACFGAINFAFNLLSNNYFKVNSLTIGHAIGALIACSIFAILAICLIMGCCKKLLDYFNSNIDNIRLFLSKALPHKEQGTTCPRACIVFFSYIATIIILVAKPALLVPIFGQMIDSKSSIGFAFASLNIIYAILMFLLIFSLQKTARKNTIVPN